MRENTRKMMVAMSETVDRPVAKIARGAIEVGMVVPSILKTRLEEAGYKVTFHTGPKDNDKEGNAAHGSWVQVREKAGKNGGNIVARAYSHDKGDALLQAVFGWMKEEANRAPIG